MKWIPKNIWSDCGLYNVYHNSTRTTKYWVATFYQQPSGSWLVLGFFKNPAQAKTACETHKNKRKRK